MSNYEELNTFLANHDLQEKAVRAKFSDLIRRIGSKDLIDIEGFYLNLSKRIKPAKRPRKKIWELNNSGLIAYHHDIAMNRLQKIKNEINRTPDSDHIKLLKLKGIENQIDYNIDKMNNRLEEIKQQNIDKLRDFNDEDQEN